MKETVLLQGKTKRAGGGVSPVRVAARRISLLSCRLNLSKPGRGRPLYRKGIKGVRKQPECPKEVVKIVRLSSCFG